MKPKYTMVLAVLAVAFMMGSALVPLASGNGYDSEPAAITYNTDKEASTGDLISSGPMTTGDSLSLSSLLAIDPLDLIGMLLSSAEVSYEKNSSEAVLIPVENDTDYSTMTKWDGKDVSLVKTVGLYEDASIILSSDVYIGAGATLVLFPTTAKTNLTFTVTSDDDDNEIFLKDGAFLDIFGLKFKVVADKDLTNGFCLFDGGDGTMKVESGIKDGKLSAYAELTKNSAFDLIFAKLVNATGKDQTLEDAAVKITADITSEKNKVELSSVSMTVKSQMGDVDEPGAIDATVTEESLKITNSATSNSKGKTDIAFGSMTGNVTVKNGTDAEADPVIQITGLAAPSGYLSVEMEAKQVYVEENELYYSVEMKMGLDDSKSVVVADLVIIEGMAKAANITSGIDSIEVKIVDDPANHKTEIYANIIGESDFKIGSMDVTTGLLTKSKDVAAPSAFISNLSLSISNTSFYFLSAKGAETIDLKLGSAELKADVFAVNVETAPETYQTVMSITGLSFTLGDVDVDAVIGAVPSVEASIGSIGLSGKVYYPSMLKQYPVTLKLSGSEIAFTYKNAAAGGSVGELVISASVRYDGMDRTLAAEVKGVTLTMEKEKTSDPDKVPATITKIGVNEISASCNIPFEKMNFLIMYNIDTSASGKNINVEIGPNGIIVGGEYVKIDNRTPIPQTLLLEAILVEAKDFKISGKVLEAESISGYLKNLGEKEQDFSISKKGDDMPTISFEKGDTIALKIEKGRAEFKAGYIPTDLIVGKDTVFVADGLSADNFVLEKGAILSGIVALDTAETTKDGSRKISYSGIDLVTISPLEGKILASAGYKLLFDIGTLGGGKLVACEGTMMPDWKSDYGTKWSVSDDKSYATYDTGNGASFCFETDCKAYRFSYSGEDSVEKKFGETVILKEVPAKEGMAAIGWSDGSGKNYPAGFEYRMPARDVVMTAQYADVAPSVSVKGMDVTVTSEAASTVLVEKKSLEKVGEGGTLTIGAVGIEVKMSDETLQGLNPSGGLILSVNKVTEYNETVKKNIVGNGMLYNISLTEEDGTEFAYDNYETFHVKLNVDVNGKVDHFNITYLGEDYHTHAVGVTSFTQSNDNSCEVAFECNHFSDYIIEPVYKTTNWGEIALMVVLIVIVVALIFVAAVRVSKAEKY